MRDQLGGQLGVHGGRGDLLGDTVADAFSGDVAADNSSVDGAARPQHSSDRCHDSENNNCNNQPRI